ncbi:ABC transporter substrate-binding protein [Rhodococcoides corynebacterioides]|uniref:ABC transporter substrate-binding protein n=1 Tax=Rhodococcoides corynebacterioides TaxID=53972 RepID=UPI001C9A7CCE|nr:ABC transporter substrate-binding protein [Rhodococcus corynebacterioides]MBY6348852.1 peptide ABC transporter substrate-binding protein [Rhodococcus corynebacterioides]MBY6361741.1 peptide ABC transporter substrate-binding protein [Rhodococcus corynebacterioides]
MSVAALTAAACGSGRTDGGGEGGDAAGDALVVGTTDQVYSLDPAASYDNGSFTIMNQVYPFLMNYAPGSDELQPDAAESCEFSQPTVYTCTLKDGLTFANGNALTSEDVKFSFDRIVSIDDPNGPSSLLANLDSVAAPDDRTVEFTLKAPNDQTFPQVLATNTGPIVDSQVFSADAILDDDAVVAGKPFAGPYSIDSYEKNSLVSFSAFDGYKGVLGTPKTSSVTLRTYTSADNLKLDMQNKSIDVAWRSLTPTDIESLEGTEGLTVHEGPGGELRYVVFNLNTMPGGTPEQKLAIRKAVAASVDRDALSENVYKGTFTPAWSVVPSGLEGANTAFKDIYGESPNKDEAAKFLSDAGIQTPVAVNLQYNPDHYGSSSSEEYAAVKAQLEDTGLFTVNLQSTEWNTYNKERVADTYPVYQLGWFPDFPDADNYLTPFFAPDNFLQNHFDNPEITALIDAERTETDEARRSEIIGEIQTKMAQDHVSTLPLLEGKQIAISTDSVTGVDETLDASFKFRFTPIAKG